MVKLLEESDFSDGCAGYSLCLTDGSRELLVRCLPGSRQSVGDSRVQADLLQSNDVVALLADGFVYDAIGAFADLLDPREGVLDRSCELAA